MEEMARAELWRWPTLLMQTTSLTAYINKIKPSLGERQKAVYMEILKGNSLTNSEIAASLNAPINTITPRTNELVKMGRVEMDTKRTCRVTGRTAIAWRTARPPQVMTKYAVDIIQKQLTLKI